MIPIFKVLNWFDFADKFKRGFYLISNVFVLRKITIAVTTLSY